MIAFRILIEHLLWGKKEVIQTDYIKHHKGSVKKRNQIVDFLDKIQER